MARNAPEPPDKKAYKADYQNATPEQVAMAVLKYRSKSKVSEKSEKLK